MSAIVRKGEEGVDFSFSKPPAQRLVELGYTFVVGYISTNASKNITKAQIDSYLAAGLKVLLVWELSATRANLGATYGSKDGLEAKRQAEALGYPHDVPILVADDTNATAQNLAYHVAYMGQFAAACDPYHIGIYGDTDILAAIADEVIGWVPNAWSWSGTSRSNAEAKALAIGAHVVQRTGFYIDNTWAVDPNVAIRDFPAWGLPERFPTDVPTPPPAAPTVSQEDDVFQGFVQDEQGHFWARGIDYDGTHWSQWACLIEELGVRWELYNLPLATVSTASLEACHRLPVWYTAPVNAVAVQSFPKQGTWTVTG